MEGKSIGKYRNEIVMVNSDQINPVTNYINVAVYFGQ